MKTKRLPFDSLFWIISLTIHLQLRRLKCFKFSKIVYNVTIGKESNKMYVPVMRKAKQIIDFAKPYDVRRVWNYSNHGIDRENIK